MIKVLIADDHAVVREGLKQILMDDTDFNVAGEASNGLEVMELVRKDSWDVLLLDITMPNMSGLEVLQQVKAEKPELPVLILSMHPEDQYAVRVLRAGAAGYITKGSAPDHLVGAVRKVARGGKYISARVAEDLATRVTSGDASRPQHEALSDREFQVMRGIAMGKSLTDIADELSLSAKTVSTYRSRILDKMNMKSNAEITRYAVEYQLVE